MRSFQTELFSRFLPSSYARHVNLTASKHWRFMPKWKHGSTVELIIFRVHYFLSAYTIKTEVLKITLQASFLTLLKSARRDNTRSVTLTPREV